MLTSLGLTLRGRMLQLPLKSSLARGTMSNATAEGPNVNCWHKWLTTANAQKRQTQTTHKWATLWTECFFRETWKRAG